MLYSSFKKVITTSLLLLSITIIFAQENDLKKVHFDKTKLFTGGNVNIAFFTGGVVLGANPHFGYSLTNWLDVAVKANYIYTGQKDAAQNKYRSHVISPGMFVRAFPLPFLFVQVQPEHNFIWYKKMYSGGSTASFKADVNSLLLGAGYCQGREAGQNTYFYFSVMIDVLQSPFSPYVDNYQRAIPVVSAGFNIALFQGGKRR